MQQQQQLNLYFNENLLPSKNVSVKFWRELNEMKLEDVRKLHIVSIRVHNHAYV